MVGSELLSGLRQDLNGHYASQFLSKQGISVLSLVFCKDSSESICDSLDFLEKKYSPSLIFISGGLGPTQDDQTQKALSRYLGLEGQEFPCEKAKALVQSHYDRLGRIWDVNLTPYHILPKGIEALYNPVGLAPALYYKKDTLEFFALPGVPSEFQAILSSLNFFENFLKKSFWRCTFFLTGIGESSLFLKKAPSLWKELEELGFEVSSLPSSWGITVALQSSRKDIEKKRIEELPSYKNLIPYLLGYTENESLFTLESFLFSLLKKNKITVSLAESCTGGYLSHILTNREGASDFFLGSVVCYSNSSKENILKVPSSLFQIEGVYSLAMAKELAKKAQELFKSRLGIGITGEASSENEWNKGKVFVSFCLDENVYHSFEFECLGTRQLHKQYFSQQIMKEVLLFLKEQNLC